MEERKDRRILKVVALLVALAMAMAWGMVVGGGLVYAWMHFTGDRGVQAHVRVLPELEVRQRVEEHLELPEIVDGRFDAVGAIVIEVVPRGPADRAGLEGGDIIVAVDGRRFRLDTNLADLISAYDPGEKVVLAVRRPDMGDEKITVRLGEHPDHDGRAYLGLKYAPSGGFGDEGQWGPHFYFYDGAETFEVPFGEFPFDSEHAPFWLEELPGDFEFYVVPKEHD
jgi:hypothetical protein